MLSLELLATFRHLKRMPQHAWRLWPLFFIAARKRGRALLVGKSAPEEEFTQAGEGSKAG
jgi:hypothetical protein